MMFSDIQSGYYFTFHVIAYAVLVYQIKNKYYLSKKKVALKINMCLIFNFCWIDVNNCSDVFLINLLKII